MELSLPDVFSFSVEALVGAIVSLILVVWAARAAYGRVMGAIAELRRDVEGMRERSAEHQRRSEHTSDRLIEVEKSLAVILARGSATEDKLDRLLNQVEKLILPTR